MPAAVQPAAAAASPRRMATETRRRERLLDATARCVAERGFHDTSVDAIVARARTSKSAFYDLFPSKEGAFADLLEREGERMLRALAVAVSREEDPARRARAGVATFVRACGRDVTMARVLLIESVGISPLVEQRRRELNARFATLIREFIEARRGGALAPPLDGDVLGFAVIGAVNEAVVHLLESGGDPEHVVATLEHLARNGLLP